MKKSNIITFERGADFYFKLGYRRIQNGDLKSALRYIEKAVKLKPQDSSMQFNYAGLLAELGNIDLSTQILLHIVDELDPDYDECYFGLGCNYLQLQKIKKSVEYFSKYLEKDPEGEFAEEAEDLLEMLNMIKDANNNLDDEELEKIYKIEEEAIGDLEKRQYKSAVEKFERVVKMLPNAVPARNNLSLAYYYQGDLQKALEIAREVIGYEPYNIHANCNLAIFYNKLELASWMEKQIKIIKKLETENPEYLYKIADTLGSLGKHEEAYKMFKKLLGVEPDNGLYIHYTAISAYNSGKFNDSIVYWRKLMELDRQSMLPDYYIQLAQGEVHQPLPYLYQLPKDEINKRLAITQSFVEGSREQVQKLMLEKQGQDGVLFGLCFDPVLIRELAFDKIKRELLRESEIILRKLLLSDTEDEIKIETVFLLDIIGAQPPYTVVFKGEIMEITAESLSMDIYTVNAQWENIIKKAHKGMKGQYKRDCKSAVEDMWMSFIKYLYPSMPNTEQVESWAAALEYVYCRLNGIKATQEEIAAKYEVKVASFRNKYKQILSSIINRADYKEKR
jgi:tetratricopeptide (TPR) repeat protein